MIKRPVFGDFSFNGHTVDFFLFSEDMTFGEMISVAESLIDFLEGDGGCYTDA